MSVSLTTTLQLLSLFSLTACQFWVNKCCPDGFQYDISHRICDDDIDYTDSEDWFPMTTVINATTLLQQKLTDVDSIDINYNFTPSCDNPLQEFVYNEGGAADFNIMVDDNLKLQLAVPVRGSYDGANVSLEQMRNKGTGCSPMNETKVTRQWRPTRTQLEYDDVEQYYFLPNMIPWFLNKSLLNKVKTGQTRCHRKYYNLLNRFQILKNGSVKIKKYATVINNTHYCGEVTMDDRGEIVYQNMFYFIETELEEESSDQLLNGILMILGGVTLLMVVIIYLYLPELRKKLHNKIAICHNVSLTIAYFALSGTIIAVDKQNIFCVLPTLLIQFSFLASFFWLNVMCFDICVGLGTKSRRTDPTGEKRNKFRYYSAYAWGAASIFCILTLIMEYAPGVPDSYYPGMECNCAFGRDLSAVLIYLYCPIALVLILNLILLVITAVKIWSINRHKGDGETTSSDVHTHVDRQRFTMYCKLFLWMGLPWILEIINWMIEGSAYYWILTDVINTLRAVFIFVIFVCKKPVWLSLKHRLIARRQSTASGVATFEIEFEASDEEKDEDM